MNSTFNQDRSSVYKKAYETLSGYSSKNSSPKRQQTDDSPSTQKKTALQFRTPILDHTLRQSAEMKFVDESENLSPLPKLAQGIDTGSSLNSGIKNLSLLGQVPVSSIGTHQKLPHSSGTSFNAAPMTPPSQIAQIEESDDQLEYEENEANRLLKTQHAGQRSKILLKEELMNSGSIINGRSPSLFQQLSGKPRVDPIDGQRTKSRHVLD